MEHKRLTLFAGHYGSGKTNLAVNYALLLAKEGKKVCIADLDIVNPYFRTKDSAAVLEAAGIDLISPQYANSNVDLPALPAASYRLVQDLNTYGIMDIGGDDRGAYALGRFTPSILQENNYRMIFVANCYRPLTRTAEDAMEVAREHGAQGGTIINGRGVARENEAAFFGISVHAEKEILMMVVEKDIRDQVLHAMYKQMGMKKKAQGIVFALPVSDVAGLVQLPDSLEAKDE